MSRAGMFSSAMYDVRVALVVRYVTNPSVSLNRISDDPRFGSIDGSSGSSNIKFRALSRPGSPPCWKQTEAVPAYLQNAYPEWNDRRMFWPSNGHKYPSKLVFNDENRSTEEKGERGGLEEEEEEARTTNDGTHTTRTSPKNRKRGRGTGHEHGRVRRAPGAPAPCGRRCCCPVIRFPFSHLFWYIFFFFFFFF